MAPKEGEPRLRVHETFEEPIPPAASSVLALMGIGTMSLTSYQGILEDQSLSALLGKTQQPCSTPSDILMIC